MVKDNFSVKKKEIKVTREIIISIIVIILIITLDVITVQYTSKSVSILSNKMEEIKNDILNKKKEEEIANQIEELKKQWENYYKKLAYYIEHDELEKVETKLSRIDGYVELGEYEDTIAELEETIFILSHIEDKQRFSVQSMF